MDTKEIYVDENMLVTAYLFLSVDGSISKAATKLFDMLGEQSFDFDNSREEIIGKAKSLLRQKSALQSIKEIYSEWDYYDMKTKLFLLWTLINIGYADGNYSSAERKIVRTLAECLEVEKSYVEEMEDTAFVLNMNETRKTNIAELSNDRNYRNELQEQIEDDNTTMVESINELIFMN